MRLSDRCTRRPNIRIIPKQNAASIGAVSRTPAPVGQKLTMNFPDPVTASA
jgi:hypothetical protein